MNWHAVSIFGLCVSALFSIVTFAWMMATFEHGTLREARVCAGVFAASLVPLALSIGVAS